MARNVFTLCLFLIVGFIGTGQNQITPEGIYKTPSKIHAFDIRFGNLSDIYDGKKITNAQMSSDGKKVALYDDKATLYLYTKMTNYLYEKL